MGSWDEAWLADYQARRWQSPQPPPVVAPSSRPRGTPEHDFQAATIDYLRLVLPSHCLLTSIDHANAKSAVAGALRKRRGVIAGIPDIYIANGSTTVWLECKARKGSISAAQRHFRDMALKQGHHWFAVRTLDEVMAALRQAPLKLR